MGAALTYARRYALFTLVGIAGEDDLDAHDLIAPDNQSSDQPKAPTNGSGGQKDHALGPTLGRPQAMPQRPGKTILEADASAALRTRLIVELDQLGSGEEAAIWAHRCLREKNQLTAEDAQAVEEAFKATLKNFEPPPVAEPSSERSTSTAPFTQKRKAKRSRKHPDRSQTIDKSALALPEPRRIRDPDHVKFVAQQSCLVCGRRPADAHHLRFAQSRALSRKVSDEFVVPVCRGHHREIHRCGDEAAWWGRTKIDPIVAARSLWLRTHPLAKIDADPDVDKLTPSPILPRAAVNLSGHVTENELTSPHQDSRRTN
jgi:hypothetical protein